MKHRLCLTFATVFYIGFLPGAPGTYAAAVTAAVFFAISYFGGVVPALHLSAVGLITLAGVLASHEISAAAGEEDPSFIVIDEVAGQLLTYLFVPMTILNLVLGFLFFRLFDIWKPFPIRKLEPLPEGVGIMADDLLAGIYGSIVLFAFNRFI